MPSNITNNSGNFRGGGRNQRHNTRARNPNQCKYCWTHRLCNHFGQDYRTKADGHQNEAIKENRMGGSVKNIPLAEQ